MRHKVPPNPETIFAGLVSFSFGNIVPREIAMALRPIHISIIAREYKMVSSVLILKSKLDRNISNAVMAPVIRQDVRNF